MHGRPRKSPTAEEAAASEVKAKKLRALQSQLLHNHSNKIYNKEAVDLSAQLLEINPESYTAWNYRKLAVEFNLVECGSDPELINHIYEEELRLTEIALRKNPKSYGAWYHRKWVIGRGKSSVEKEMNLLGKFQSLDSRNFHAWNYRRFVAELMKRPEEEELEYTQSLIDNNFSNYSAWHNRSVLLSNLLRKKVKNFEQKEEVLAREYDLVRGAIFTDEDDQSGWFYHLWLLNQTIKSDLPVLVSSWPAHGSEITLTSNSDSAELNTFRFEGGIFPLILYFDQAVTGVNTSTVEVEYDSNKNEDLVWNPLSSSSACYSQVWVTRLNFLVSVDQSSSVIVTIGSCEGITSKSGLSFSGTSSLKFVLHVHPNKSDISPPKVNEYCSSTEEMYLPCKCPSAGANPLPISEMPNFFLDQESILSSWKMKIINEEIENFHLLSDCKIGKLTLARLFAGKSESSQLEKAFQLYKDLMLLNPQHKQYYKDQQSLVLLQQITSNAEEILSYCFYYRKSASDTNGTSIIVRMNNLSLSRLGSFEKLLWVQMLDLSQNDLHSLEGLEAMPLLTHLFLSKNKFSSFSALEPLKSLKSLKVLDISYNRIGAHSVDTTRYFFCSPLSHTLKVKWDEEKLDLYSMNSNGYLEAYFIFKGLRLTQLDVAGNPIANQKFSSFLVSILPSLQWLDGALIA